jgi:hypothetical protein
MPERARLDPWEPQGSNSLGPPGLELVPQTADGRSPGMSLDKFLHSTSSVGDR